VARQLRWHEVRRRRKARAGKNSFPPTPFLFARPSGKVLIKIQRPDFRQKKFGF